MDRQTDSSWLKSMVPLGWRQSWVAGRTTELKMVKPCPMPMEIFVRLSLKWIEHHNAAHWTWQSTPLCALCSSPSMVEDILPLLLPVSWSYNVFFSGYWIPWVVSGMFASVVPRQSTKDAMLMLQGTLQLCQCLVATVVRCMSPSLFNVMVRNMCWPMLMELLQLFHLQ